MTEKACDRCYNPLMRSPRNQVPVEIVCVSCGQQTVAGSSSHPVLHAKTVESNTSSISFEGESQSAAEISTPVTEFSEGLLSPSLPPLETEEILHRRAQSDQASAEIGRRLLQGWAMLADECPHATCYGIPLVRPPRSKDGTVSKTKVNHTHSMLLSFNNIWRSVWFVVPAIILITKCIENLRHPHNIPHLLLRHFLLNKRLRPKIRFQSYV